MLMSDIKKAIRCLSPEPADEAVFKYLKIDPVVVNIDTSDYN